MTRIALEDQRTPGYPVVKRTAIDQTFNGAIVKAESRNRLKKNSVTGVMEPVEKPGGKFAQEMVVTCVTLPGTTAPAGLGDTESVPEPGDLVRLILKGKAFGDWIEQKKNLPDGQIAVGDIVIQKTTTAQVYNQDGKAVGDEITTDEEIIAAKMKGRSVGIYGPLILREPKADSAWTAKAVAAYHESNNQSRPSAEAGADQGDDGEPPF